MRGRWRIILVAAAAVAGLAVLLAGALLVGGNTDPGRRLIERLTAQLTGGYVTLSGLGGAFPAQLTLRELRLTDRRGVWLTAYGMSARWQPAGLLTNQVLVQEIAAARIVIARAPAGGDGGGGGGLPSIPHIKVDALSVGSLELGAALAGAPATLGVRGNVDLRSLANASGDLEARRIDGDGTYELHLRFDPRRVDGTLSVREPANGPLENLVSLPGLGSLSVQASLHGPVSATRLDLTLDAGALHGRAAGGIDLERRSAELGFSLAASAMAPSPSLAWRHVALHGRWHGAVSAPRVDGRIEAASLRLPGGLSLASLESTVTAAAGALNLRTMIGGLEIPGPNPQLLGRDPLHIDATVRLDDAAWPLSLTATHPLFALRAAAITRGRQVLDVDLRLPDVAPVAALFGEQVRGEASLKGAITRDTDTHLTLDVTANPIGGKAGWLGVLGNHATLQLAATLTARALELERLHLSGPSLSLSAQGTAVRAVAGAAPGGRAGNGMAALLASVRARWDLDLANLTALSPALAGRLTGSGTVDGPVSALRADAALSGALSVRGSQTGAVSVTLHAHGLPGAPGGTLQASGELDGAPLHLDVELERTALAAAPGRPAATVLRTVIRRGDWKSANAEGDLTIASTGGEARGRLRVRIDQLGDLDRLLGTTLQGHVESTVEFKPEDGHAQGSIRVVAHDLVAGPLAGDLQLTGDGPTEAIRLGLHAQVPALRGAPADLTAAGVLDLDHGSLRLDTASFDYRQENVHLLAPASLAFADGLSLTELKLGARRAVLRVAGRLLPLLDMQASLRDVGPDEMNTFLPAALAAGTIEADVDVQGSFAAPTGHVRLDGRGLRAADEVADGLPALSVHATAELRGDTAAVDARLDAGAASALTVAGIVPLNPSGAFGVKVSGKLDVGLVNPVLEAGGEHASGTVTVDAAVSGTGGAPEIAGTIRLAQGTLRDYALGVNLSNISGEIGGTQGMLEIKSFTATAASGTVSMTGTIGVLEPGLPLDLKITAHHAEPLVNEIVTANVEAALTVSGKAREHLELAGTVHVNKATINIPDTLPPDVAVLDVRRRGIARMPPPGKPLVIAMNVAVQAPQQILVKGRGLDAELGGDLHLGGTTADPVVSGGLDLQRGTFSLASTTLNFTSGKVTFEGANIKNRIDPTLDFTAESTFTDPSVANSISVTLRITGLADAPQFSLTSVPAGLPTDQILAGLLFGEPASSLTPLQLASIGNALASLGGGGGGLNPLAKIQKTLGLDRLNVGQVTTVGPTGATTNAGYSIEAGRYVAKRIFVEAKQTTTGTSQVQVNVDLTKHLKLQTRLGNGTATVQGTTPENDPGSSIGLSYQFEY